jgi:hypothetical protein
MADPSRLWVKNGPDGPETPLPVDPDQRTSSDRRGWSGSCQYQKSQFDTSMNWEAWISLICDENSREVVPQSGSPALRRPSANRSL